MSHKIGQKAMQTVVIARLFVCLSATFRCLVQTNKDTIVRFSASGRTIILVSGWRAFLLLIYYFTPWT